MHQPRQTFQRLLATGFPSPATKSVAVLGAGHGGLALAGDLALRGFRVHLWNRSAAPLAKVRSEGGIRLAHGAIPSRFAPIAAASCRIGASLEQADAVLVAVPASAHADIARAAAPYLRDRHSVLLLPGRTGGAVEFQRVLLRSGCRSGVLIGETNTFPFASRCTEPGAAAIFGTKAEMLAAALAPHRTPELLNAFRPLLPMLQPAQSVLQTGFGNVGAILHPTITLMNRERIRSGVPFDFYTDGVTAEVAEVLAAADEERLSIARAFGVPVCSLPEWIASAYGHRADSMLKTVGGNPAYAGIKAPNTLVHRYLLEDVPTGLIPMLELGRAAGIAAPTLRKLVDLACSVLKGRAWQWPRTLRTLGLEGLSVAQLRERLESGTRPSVSLRTWLPRFSVTVGSKP